jgi:hypothetical protein
MDDPDEDGKESAGVGDRFIPGGGRRTRQAATTVAGSIAAG